MVKISKIYTRTGDDGTTGLVGGTRIAKSSLRVSAYGDIDELNSFLGQARTLAEKTGATTLTPLLADVQNELFDIGAELATPPGGAWEGMKTISVAQVTRLEQSIDELTRGIPELRSFVLPGGTELNASLHICRAVSRRAERSTLALAETEPVSNSVRLYLNRLSDLLFAMARYESHRSGVPEYLWEVGRTGDSEKK